MTTKGDTPSSEPQWRLDVDCHGDLELTVYCPCKLAGFKFALIGDANALRCYCYDLGDEPIRTSMCGNCGKVFQLRLVVEEVEDR